MTDKSQGLSSVVGVLLLTALVVVLAAGLFTFIVDLGDVQETSSVAVSADEGENGLKIRVITNGESDRAYGNGRPFPDVTAGTEFRPLPDEDGYVEIVTEKEGDYTYQQRFEGEPTLYDVNGSIQVSFEPFPQFESDSGTEYNWFLGGGAYDGGLRPIYCSGISASNRIYSVNPTFLIYPYEKQQGCPDTTYPYPVTGESVGFALSDDDHAVVATDPDTGNVVGTAGIVSDTDNTDEDRSFQFSDDGTASNPEPLIGYDGQSVEFAFDSGDPVDWSIEEENGATIQDTPPNNAPSFNSTLDLSNPSEQGDFVMVARDSGGTVVDRKRVVVLPSDTSEYTYSGGGKTSGGGGSGDDTVSGGASINPQIDGATVKAFNGSELVDQNTTASNGEFEVSSKDITEVKVNVSGFTHPDLSAPLYATATRDVSTDGDITKNFTFRESTSSKVDVNGDGSDELVATELEEVSRGFIQIGSVEELQAMQADVTADYRLINDINATKTSNWNGGDGFKPIGNASSPYTGTFDGSEYQIDGLEVSNSSLDNAGFIGYAGSGATVKTVELTQTSINGGSNTGVVAGFSNGSISRVNVTGTVDGGSNVGGVAGANGEDGSISIASGQATVIGSDTVGGVVGQNNGSVTEAFASGQVSGSSNVGGAIGAVAGSHVESNAYWDTEATGQPTSAGSETGLTTSEMTGESVQQNMNGFDFSNNWQYVATEYPVIKEFVGNLSTLTATTEDPDGVTLSGSTVEIQDNSGNTLLTNTTDSNGDAVFDNVPSDTYTLFADKDGYSSENKGVVLSSSSETEKLTLNNTLSTYDNVTLNITRVSTGEADFLNVTVENTEAGDTRTGETDSTGVIEFDGMYDGEYNVTIDETEYQYRQGEQVASFNVSSDGEDNNISVETYALINVTDRSTGDSISGANVEIDSQSRSSFFQNTTEADGNTTFTQIPLGRYDIYITESDYVDLSTTFSMTESKEFSLEDDANVEVEAVKKSDGNAISGADVRLDEVSDSDTVYGITNSTGVASFTSGIAQSEYDVNVSKDGFVSNEVRETFNSDSESVTVTLEESSVSCTRDTTAPTDGDGDGYKEVDNASQLQCIQQDLGANYELASDIDAYNTSSWNNGKGFAPIGSSSTPFTGKFNGSNNEINDLYINRSTTVGLFHTASGQIENVTVDNPNIENNGTDASTFTGVLVGDSTAEIKNVDVLNNSTTESTYAESEIGVIGYKNVGGIAGTHDGLINNVEVNVSVESDRFSTKAANIGGLVGKLSGGEINNGIMNNSVSSGSRNIGGVVGHVETSGNVENSVMAGSVGTETVNNKGGLVGINKGTVSKSYVRGDINDGYEYVGGVVGQNNGDVFDVYSTANITSQQSSYGAIAGSNSGSISDAYWDEEATGIIQGVGSSSGTETELVGLRTEDMTDSDAESNMTGFDFSTTWYSINKNYPALQVSGEVVDETVDPSGVSTTVLEDFESGTFSNEFTVYDSNFDVVTGKQFESSYSAGIQQTSTSQRVIAEYKPDEWSGGVQVQELTYYWYETDSSYGAALTVLNSSGGRVASMATNNPQWAVVNAAGNFEQIYSGDGKGRWIKVKMEFDYSNNNVRYTVRDTQTGSEVTETRGMDFNSSDVETIHFENFDGGNTCCNRRSGGGSMYMWYDYLESKR